jgi:hypothetical protein
MDVDLSSLFELDARPHFGNPHDANSNWDKRFGLKHGITPGTVFKNARKDDDALYVVKQVGQKLTLVRKADDGKETVTIAPEDLNTMILYKVKDGEVKNT